MEVKRIGWYNKDAFKQVFEHMYEDIFALYQQMSTNQRYTYENIKIWLEPLSEKSELLCLSINEEGVEYGYFFVIEKIILGTFITNCYQFYKEWDIDYSQLSKGDFIKNLNYYLQYTDMLPNESRKGTDRPLLSYFKDNEHDMLTDRYFKNDNLLFTFNVPSHKALEDFPELKEKLSQMTPDQFNYEKAKQPENVDVNTSNFFYQIEHIIRVGNAVQVLSKKEPNFKERIKQLEKQIAEFVSKDLSFSGYDIAEVVRLCQRKKAGSKKTAVKGHYSKAWITKKGKRKTMVIEFCNFLRYTYAFVIHDIKDDYALFDCYRVFDTWEEDASYKKTNHYIQTLHDFLESDSDYNRKPTLDMLLSNIENYTPIFSFKEEKTKDSLYGEKLAKFNVSFEIKDFSLHATKIEDAIQLMDRFQED